MKRFLFSFLALVILFSLSASIAKEKRTADKGLYITYWISQTRNRFDYIKKQAKAAGFNTLIIDVKQKIEAPLIPLVKSRSLNDRYEVQADPWLTQLVKELHEEGFIVSGRIVVFKDDHLAIARPDLAITGYRDRKGGRWVSPHLKEVRLYNALIAEIAAKSGIDEVQFDYIRFPAEGAIPTDRRSKVDAINQFLKEAKERLQKYDVSIAVDIFGVTAWQSDFDIKTLGQSIEAMAEYIDVLCPMLYPSHFHNGYDGFANPGDHPYYFINSGVAKSLELIGDKKVKLVPWLQGFALGTNNFGKNYIQQQINACTDEGVSSFLIWNAGNRYDSLPVKNN
ncbi:hypothetical protein A2276_07255 [candidate division WOR-1 bacterium RIFOXYA12_FULL_43_27]|uniref:DUF4015 domain-containing protein n=1 Tax=candidate division WOR-1 bacterium RIFOXYC2_FULL_46_14 TaxID=1802587 RepID=A0A1F4U602_UNCSA|nr:MAG: hypothetical protein A2276_07255 [candidate division WOR-1 bacterium RIFOXYA12_FULL_43_27]OGC20404.1 MAG: hypothetical protein A2292_05080 [candidate division WOR-1 bacterium RIFOXYB2_FULL_46_45]OGC31859.1 MAG: hypothetical protein A2232_06370 [candidate division WOR-1 bacterium RIFOXYA2_FULL_46_56]OGC40250.1 MAG: hypothetical protein A2438_03100 [candidate division WOR-1 bacterium RIFOXYC2_FULL_46_14]